MILMMVTVIVTIMIIIMIITFFGVGISIEIKFASFETIYCFERTILKICVL